ncbi:MAG TPA: phage major capsid protein [Humisphaera sp.]|jgi:HK97 family phage major capsid protein|nr:phage major capsid protein [Humisphaera sp.]
MDWAKIKGLKEQRGAKIAEMKTILATAEAEKRELSEDETKRYDAINAELPGISANIERLESLRSHTATHQIGYVGAPGRDAIGDQSGAPENRAIFSPLNGAWSKRSGRQQGGYSEQPLSMGRFLRGVLQGQWDGAEAERRTLGVGAGGTVLVPTPLSDTVLMAATSKAQVFKAGAQIVPMSSSTLKIPRMQTLPQMAFRAENAAINAADASLDSITLTAKSAGVICKLSLELEQDAAGVDALVEKAMADAAALLIDYACLSGTGSNNEPTGLGLTSGIQTITSVGSLSDYSKFSTAAQRLAEVNAQAGAAIMHPNSYFVLDQLQDTLHQPLKKPDSVANMPFLPSNQLATPATVTITGTAGTFTLVATAGGTTATTSALAFNASTATVQAALVALTNIGTGNATVTGSAGAYSISFSNFLTWLGAVKITADGSSLTGGTATAAQTTTAYVGQWSSMLVGMRENIMLEVSREASDANSSAWANGQIFLRMLLRMDVQIARPNQFVKLSGINVV